MKFEGFHDHAKFAVFFAFWWKLLFLRKFTSFITTFSISWKKKFDLRFLFSKFAVFLQSLLSKFAFFFVITCHKICYFRDLLTKYTIFWQNFLFFAISWRNLLCATLLCLLKKIEDLIAIFWWRLSFFTVLSHFRWNLLVL